MAGRKKAIQGKLVRFELRLTEEIDEQLNSFLDSNPYTDKTKTIRQAIAEFLERRQPSDQKRHIA